MPSAFLGCLDWVVDLTTVFVVCVGHGNIPRVPHPQDVVAQLQPQSTAPLAFRLLRLFIIYLLLDALKNSMMKDPYFLGFVNCPPPGYLVKYKDFPSLIDLYRKLFSFAGFHASMILNFGVGPLLFVDLLGPKIVGVRGEGWMYPLGYGDFSAVLNRGLQGWWGEWWHQLFRFTTLSTGHWVTKQLRLVQGNFARHLRLFIAFSLSGALHAAVSYILWGLTWQLGPLLFFLLQAVGVSLQLFFAKILRLGSLVDALRRIVRRVSILSIALVDIPAVGGRLRSRRPLVTRASSSEPSSWTLLWSWRVMAMAWALFWVVHRAGVVTIRPNILGLIDTEDPKRLFTALLTLLHPRCSLPYTYCSCSSLA